MTVAGNRTCDLKHRNLLTIPLHNYHDYCHRSPSNNNNVNGDSKSSLSMLAKKVWIYFHLPWFAGVFDYYKIFGFTINLRILNMFIKFPIFAYDFGFNNFFQVASLF